MVWDNAQLTLVDAATSAAEFATNWLLQSTLLILAGLAIGMLLKRGGSAVQSAVYRTTLIAALVCPLATWGLSLAGVSGWSVELPAGWSYVEAAPSRDAPQPEAAVAKPVPTDALEATDRLDFRADEIVDQPAAPFDAESDVAETRFSRAETAVESTLPAADVAANVVEVASATELIDDAPQLQPTVEKFGAVALAAIAVWLIGTAVLAVRLSVAWWRLVRLRRRSASAEHETVTTCRELARSLAVSAPEVRRSPFLPSPCLAGLRRPAVLLPGADVALHVRDVLIHELAHLKRHDCHWNLLRQAATAVFFFQPLLWVLSRHLESTAEEVCDDFVVAYGGDRRDYANRLVEIAELSTAPFAAAGVGIVSLRSMLAKRVSRIMDTSRGLSTRVGNLLLAVVLVGGLIGTTVVGLVGLGPQPLQAEAEAFSEGPEEGANDEEASAGESPTDQQPEPVRTTSAEASSGADEDVITVRGTVIDPQGKLLDGATIEAQRWIHDADEAKEPLATTESNADGGFELRYPASDLTVTYVASADGYGSAFVRDDQIRPGEELKLKLVEDNAPIRGRVVDPEGNPLAGVTVKIGGVSAPIKGTLDDWLDALKRGQLIWQASNRHFKATTPQNPANVPDKVTTDNNGYFSIRGVGGERKISIALEGPTVAYTQATVVTRTMQPVVANDGVPDPEWSRQHTVYGSDFQIVAPPTQPITGTVRDPDTGEPLAGVSVESHRMTSNGLSGERLLRTQSDEQGRYTLVGMLKGDGRRIVAVPNDDQPYLMREFDVPDRPGLEPIELDLELHRGVWISGQLTDKLTGKPISNSGNSHVLYFPYRSNPHAQALPEYDEHGNTDGYQQRYKVDDNGRYKLVGLAGKAIVGAMVWGEPFYPRGQGSEQIKVANEHGHFPTYRNGVGASTKHPTVMREVDIPEGTERYALDFELDRGRSIRITPVDAAGHLLRGLQAAGVAHRESWTEVDDAPFDVLALGPNEERTLLLHHIASRLGGVAQLSERDSPDALTVELQPCVTVRGRLVDDNEQPIPAAMIRVSPRPGGDFSPELKKVLTDDDGRFQHDGVLPGTSYSVMAESVQKGFSVLAKALAVSPGETIDLGTIDVTKDERPEPMRTESSAAEARYRYAGQVLDADGQPVGGARLYLSYWYSDQSTSLDARPLATTDGDGRFEFEIAQSDFRRTGDSVPPWMWASIVAVAEGHGAAWGSSLAFETSGLAERQAKERLRMQGQSVDEWEERVNNYRGPLRLAADDLPIEGRLVDINGQPISGARVKAVEVRTGKDNTLDAWEKAAQQPDVDLYEASRSAEKYLYGPFVPELFAQTKTDKNGRFRLSGIGRERLVKLVAQADGFEATEIHVRTREADSIPLEHPWRGKTQVHGAQFTQVLGPSRAVEGVVTDAKTGEPVAGVVVTSHASGTSTAPNQMVLTGSDHVRAVTDEDGRYTLLGLPLARLNPLVFNPAAGQLYLPTTGQVDTRGNDPSPVTHSVELTPAGAVIAGRVVDKETGSGVSGEINYLAAEDAANPQPPAIRDAWHVKSDIRSDTDGYFRFVAPQGKGYVAFKAYDESYAKKAVKPDNAKEMSDIMYLSWSSGPEYHALREVNVGEQQEVEISLEVERSALITGQVLGTDGEPVTDAGGYFAGRLEDPRWSPLDNGKFTVLNFDASRPRQLAFVIPEAKLAGELLLEEAPEQPLTVQLKPWATITGRVVDEDGEPIAGLRLGAGSVAMSITASPDEMTKRPGPRLPLPPSDDIHSPIETDAIGRFTIAGLLPDVEYDISGHRHRGPLNPVHGDVVLGISLSPSEKRDLGTIELKPVDLNELAKQRQEALKQQQEKVQAILQEAESFKKQERAKGDEPNNDTDDGIGMEATNAPNESRVLGNIKGKDGKPVEGAEVAVIAMPNRPRRGGDLDRRSDVLAHGTTDGNGKFDLPLQPASPQTHSYANLIARADGSGVAWSTIDLSAKTSNIDLTLPAEEPIRGRLVDLEGQPAAGVRLAAQAVMKAATDGRPSDDGVGYRGGDEDLAAWVPSVVSDQEGRFVIHGIPTGHGVFLKCLGSDRIAPQHITLNSGRPEQREEHDGTYRSLVKNVSAGEEAVLPLAPAQVFEGLVTFADTGAPAPHVRLTIWASQQEEFGSMISVAGTADDEGRYRITPVPGVRFGVTAYPPDGTPYLARKTPHDDAIRWQDGERVKQVDIALPRGVLVEGQVVEQGTNTPVAGASIQYRAESVNNPYTSDEILTGWQAIETTDNEGKFSMAVLPGPGTLLVHGPDGNYVVKETTDRQLDRGTPGGQRYYANSFQRIDPAKDADSLRISIELERGEQVAGEIVDVAGEPVDEVLVFTHLKVSPTSPFWRGHTEPTLGGRFELNNLAEGEEYKVHFLSPKRQLGATAMLSSAEPNPHVVVQPCGKAEARIVNSDGQPIPDYQFVVYMVLRPGVDKYFDTDAMQSGAVAADSDFISNVDRTNHPGGKRNGSDAEGRIEFPALIPGATYRVMATQNGEYGTAREFVATAGETTDLGDIVVDEKGD